MMSGKHLWKKIDFFILGFILLLAFVFRLYKINTPLADLHSWRQADTVAVGRNFINKGFDIIHPIYDDLSNIQSTLDNPQGYRMVEFPIYNFLFASTYKLFPSLPIHIHARLVNVFFSLIIIAIMYYLVLKESNRLSAFFASLIYAVFPFFVFFSRNALPETTALSFTLIAILFFYLLIRNKSSILKSFIYYSLSAISFALALLIKPTTIFYFLVIFYLFFEKDKFALFKKINFYLYFVLSSLPFVAWRIFIQRYPAGIPYSQWLFTSVNTVNGLKSIFMKPSFFRWIFFERINKLIFGGWMVSFFTLGVFKKNKKKLFYSFLLSSLIYLFTFQGGNVQHEYYQTLILPALAIFSGIGISFLIGKDKLFISRLLSIPLVLTIFLLSWYFSFYQTRNFYNYPSDLVTIAKVINSMTDKKSLIITDTNGDTTLLYLSERRGYPAPYKPLPQLKKQGAKYFVTSKDWVIEKFKKNKKLKLLFYNDKFALFQI